MKKIIKRLACPLLLIAFAFILTGCDKKENLDFELMAGSMVSKENMTEDEMRMHDAKVIQYAVYQTKKILAKGRSDDNSRLIGDIALSVKANLFSKSNPRDWLYTYYHFFSFYEDINEDIESEHRYNFLGDDIVESRWRCLSSNIDEMEEYVDKYVGSTFAERSKLDQNLVDNLVPILDTLNGTNLVTIYRNKDHDHKYMFGTQPEPTRESILFALDAEQKMLKVAPIGEMSTVTLAHVYVNDMIGTLSTMLEDYDATRYDPTYQTMNQWGVIHARLGGSWAGYNDLVSKTKNLFKEKTNLQSNVGEKKEVTVNLPLPQEDEKYVLTVYVDGEKMDNMTEEVSNSLKTKNIIIKGIKDDKAIVKFEINDAPYKIYDLNFKTAEYKEITD